MFDLPLSAWFHVHSHPIVTQFMLLVSLWHSTAGVLSMSALLGLALYFTGRSRWLLALLLSVPGGMLLNVAVKHLVQRARPHFDDPLLTLGTYSFPSGHTAGAALFYGFLTALVFALPGARHWRAAMVAVGVVMVLLVGLSRIYLGVHYLTDVIGAIILAVLWLALCRSGLRALSRRLVTGVIHE